MRFFFVGIDSVLTIGWTTEKTAVLQRDRNTNMLLNVSGMNKRACL